MKPALVVVLVVLTSATNCPGIGSADPAVIMDRYEFNVYSRLRNPIKNLLTGGLYADYQFLKHDKNMNGYIDNHELNHSHSPRDSFYRDDHYYPGSYNYGYNYPHY
ncbi:unnamed protein product [Brachionus calyciflorus]|uniref:Uncharacterized protein n=1 Tax=Brachionus calyciflorus TaxID=104777 RepID=A0A813XAW4_9BILA|nr:unnamed protein product [Brachionus calyciflorus]